jgi:aminopeptidase N
MMKTTARTLFRAVIPSLSVALTAGAVRGQEPDAREQFLLAEQESWMEYIEGTSSARRDSSLDVRFYHLQVDIAVDSSFIEGKVRCVFDAVSDGASAIALDLHHSLAIDSITGNVSGFTAVDDTVIVDLDRPYSAGETASLTIFYRGEPELAGGKKGLRYETHAGGEPIVATLSTPFLSHYWWPCKDGPGDKPDSVFIDIAVPDTSIGGRELIAVSNGVLDTVMTMGGKKVFRWRERYPIVPYYVMAAISNFRHYRQDYEGPGGESFPLDYYIFPEDYESAVLGVEDVPEAMGVFSTLFGAYPFPDEKYGMTQLGYYGAIENQTNTIIRTMSESWFDVTVHELSHMWFGDMITCRDWHHGWLNEGFATYAEALWAEHTGGAAAYRENMTQNEYFLGGTVYLQDISDPFNIFIDIIYQKGAYVLHMLRGVLGDDVFFDVLNRYAQDPALRYGHAVTGDFEAICEAESGMDLEFFFDQWIYDEYYPRYEFGWSQDPVTLEAAVTIRQVQESSGWRPVFEMPVQIEFSFESGLDTVVTVWNSERLEHYDFDFEEPLRSVELDPDRWILRQVQLTGIDGDGGPGTAPRVFSLEQNYPNPFNPRTTIRFTLPGPGGRDEPVPLTLRVYDSRGRVVRTLIDGERPAGEQSVVWDGRNDGGEKVGSGVFFYRINTPGHSDTRKMILLE